MPFALCMDPWSVKDVTGNLLASPAKEAAMIAALVSTDMQFMLNSGTYLAGKPVLDFGEVEAGRRLEEEQRIYNERMHMLQEKWTELRMLSLEARVIWEEKAEAQFNKELISALQQGIWLHFSLKGTSTASPRF